MSIKLNTHISILLFTILQASIISDQISSEKVYMTKEIKKPWKFDCKEKRECLSKCNSTFFLNPYGEEESYINQMRTECFRDCASQVDCNKD